MLIRGVAGGAALPGGGGAISVGGASRAGAGTDAVGDTDWATALAALPNSWRTASLMRADKSTPHSGQANVTGWRTISGEASNAYFPPQSQTIFIQRQGLGFNKTTFVPKGRAMDDAAGDDFIPPSQYKNVPPYWW